MVKSNEESLAVYEQPKSLVKLVIKLSYSHRCSEVTRKTYKKSALGTGYEGTMFKFAVDQVIEDSLWATGSGG